MRRQDESLSAKLSYAEQRIAWAQALPETTLRDLAAEYLIGQRDEMHDDAFTEFERRFGKYVKGESQHPKKAKKRRSSR